jgi:ubiquinone/menaquinone biosynthesis C-methylase UbiE
MEDSRERPVAQCAFEALAERYSEKASTKPHNAYYEWPATRTLVGDVRGKRVLDAGCGPGHHAAWLVKQGAEVVGVDISSKMLELARQRLGNKVKLHQADVSAPMPFLKDGSFDVVLAALFLDYIYDWSASFSEFYRVLKPGGHFVLSLHHPFNDFAKKGANYHQIELIEYVWRGFGGEPVTVPSYRRPLGATAGALAGAGFLIERIVEPFPTEEFQRADPKDYAELCREPCFLFIRAVVPNK